MVWQKEQRHPRGSDPAKHIKGTVGDISQYWKHNG